MSNNSTSAGIRQVRPGCMHVGVDLALPEKLSASADRDRHIPVIWDNPTMADLEEFFATLESRRERKILAHCAAN